MTKTSGMAAGFGIMAAEMIVLALVLYAIAAFLALILTIICFVAWESPVTLGKITFEPDECRAFVLRGVIGAGVVPLFIAFVQVLFNIDIAWEYWPHFLLVGYVIGSVGLMMLMANQQEEETPVETPITIEPPKPKALPQWGPDPFQYATWDDEEERK